MSEETKKRIAELAATAERDIDEGRIKLSGEAAERELARRAEAKHAARMTQQGDVAADLSYGAAALGVQADKSREVLGETEHSRALQRAAEHMRNVAHQLEQKPGFVLTDLVEGLLGKETPKSREAIEKYFAATTEVHVDVPAGFVPDFVVTNRSTKAVTFNGGELGQLVTCPRCDQRMTRRQPHDKRAFGGADEWACPCGLSCTAEGARSEHVRAGFAAAKRHAAEAATVPNEKEQAALAFCFRAAAGDSGGQRRVRQFLFAWHNAGELGGFDFADLWSLDERHLDAVLTVIGMIAGGQTGYYPHHYGYEADMEALIETYGPVRS